MPDLTWVLWDEDQGLVEVPQQHAEYGIPTDEWGAYLKVLKLASEIEDRMREQYHVGPVIPPDLAVLKGTLSDAEILALVALRSGLAAPSVNAAPAAAQPLALLPAPKPYTPPPCEHRVQTGGGRDGRPITCSACGLVLIARPGVTADNHSGRLSGSPVPPAVTDQHGFPVY